MKATLLPTLAVLSSALLSAACATLAPPDLIEARGAYATAANSPDAKLSPTALYEAQKVLEQADHEFALNGDTTEVHDLVYITMRKVALADTVARIEQDRQRIADAGKSGLAARDAQLARSKVVLAETREQMRDERSVSGQAAGEAKVAAEAQDKALAKSEGQLEEEKQARALAEGRLSSAMRELARIAAVKEETRGVVITLSGSVLFTSNQSKLLDSAKTKLDQVAAALIAQDPDKRMVVEGHTDSKGSDAVNLPLSQARADSVRDYLVGRGVDADKITAVGMGSKRPLVGNGTAEDRANNRRVEIVINSLKLLAR
jgi:outer membrane protein OmpA-like peptidoglycan-associated protein